MGHCPNSVVLPCFVCKQVASRSFRGERCVGKKKSEGQDAEGEKTRENIDAVLQPNSRFWASKVPFRLSGPTKTAHHPQRLNPTFTAVGKQKNRKASSHRSNNRGSEKQQRREEETAEVSPPKEEARTACTARIRKKTEPSKE